MAASAWLPPVDLTDSGRPVLFPGEVERLFISSIDLQAEENPSLPPLRSGLLTLTSHRLLWINETSRFAHFIPLGSVIHAFPPKKSIKSMFTSPKIRIQVTSDSDGKITSGKGTTSVVITIVMRGGKSDSEAFYGKLWEVLKSRSWEVEEVKGREDVGEIRDSGSVEGTSRVRTAVVGVAGILRKEQEMWESTDKSLQDAFQDLNALMSKAKEMVALAEKMRQKLLSGSAAQANANDEEMGSKQEMQDWLLSVGIVSPVTKESAGALYHQQLSRQLADFVKLPLEKSGGMIALIDVYCLFNRARGTELISPEDLLQACALWEKYEVPAMLRKFDSGVMVIQSKAHSDEEVFARIISLAQKPDALKMGISPSDAALTLGIAPALAKEHLLNAESRGLLCRDVSPDGFRFYVNMFKEFELGNIYLAWRINAIAGLDEDSRCDIDADLDVQATLQASIMMLER
ncbi:Vacuolar protein sorting-associated protein 36 [Dendrobium catenatum]|uniref:Vacuolar protein-sorting-associated protein 36 n=1 Tax=Dendrobium catenatum TaxID=906689 RepID=A0A2I0X2Z8_9ASPA|nr:Vacuolar protein sorting-associated protein 36 [Dendrobium catenatum]